MDAVKILVVEDEIIIADTIVDAINELGYEALEPAINYSEAIESIEKENPDLGIFDIQLSGKKTGVDLAHKVNLSYDFPFIFLTSNSDKATLEEVKQVEPSAFLVKPFNKEELYAAVELALFNFSKKQGNSPSKEKLTINDSLFIKQKDCFVRIKFSDITHIKCEGKYLDVFLNSNKKINIEATLSEYLDKLNSSFVRSHRNYLINLDYLESIHSTYVVVNEVALPVVETVREELLEEVKWGTSSAF